MKRLPKIYVGCSILSIIALLTAGLFFPAYALTGPFSWQSESWCPSYHTYISGCNGIDSPSQYSVSFNPTQVSESGSPAVINLAMNNAATVSGAFNTNGYETWTPPVTVTTQATLPCNSSNKIYNWPALWMVGTVGSWPTDGEIDIIDNGGTGSGAGTLTWGYHYTDKVTGQPGVVSGSPSGNWCGTHTFKVHWTTSAITITWDSTQVANITPTANIPIVTDPMYFTADYGASTTYAGPVKGGLTMSVKSFSVANN